MKNTSKDASGLTVKPAQSRGMSASLRRLALRRAVPLLTASALLLSGQSTFAATRTWTGNTSPNWNTIDGFDAVPVANDSLVFGVAGTAGTSLNDNFADQFTFGTMTFNAGASAYTLTNSGVTAGRFNYTKFTGNVTNNSGVVQKLGMEVDLQGGAALNGDGFEVLAGHSIISGGASGSTATINATNIIMDDGAVLNAFSGRTLTLSSASTIVSGSVIYGSVGTYNLNGTNSYAGGTTLKAGTVNIGNTAALGLSTGSLTFDRTSFASLLDLKGFNIGVGNLTSVGTAQAAAIRNTGAASTLTIGNGNATGGNYAGTISGALGITKTGAGTLTLSGADTYTGATTINGGTLQFAKQVALSSSVLPANFIVNSGGTAAFNVGGAGEYTSANIDAFQALGTGTGGFQSGSFLGLDTTNAPGGNFTYATAINNPNSGANALGLAKLGTGLLTLTGASAYTGATNINAGSLVLDHSGANLGALGNTAVNVNAGTALLVKGSTNIGNAPGGTLTLAGGAPGAQGSLDLRDGTVNTLTLGGGLTLGSGAGGSTLSLDLGAADGASDQIVAGGALTATGTNTINLNVLSALAAGTTHYTLISASSGVDFNHFTLGTKPTGFNTFTLSSPTTTALILTAQANATPATAYWTGLASATGAPPDPNNNWGYGSALAAPKSNWSTTADGLSDPVQVPGLITDVYFTAANASSNAGVLNTQLDAAYSIKSLTFDTSPQTTSPISSAAINTNGNTLTLGTGGLTVAAADNSSATLSNTGAAGGVALGTSQNWANNNNAQTLTVSAAANGTATGATQTLTLNGIGTGGVTLSGPLGDGSGAGGKLALAFGQAGVTTLSGSNTFTGGVTINSGTVQLGSAGALNAAAPNAVAFGPSSSGVLQLNGNSVTVSGLNSDATPGTPAVENGNAAATLTVNAAAANSYAGVLRDGTAGTLALTKSGAGTLTLNGANTYTGGTNFNGGVLNVGAPEAAGTGPLGASGALTFSGGTLQYSAANQSDYSSRFSAANGQAYSIDTNGQNVALATGLTSSNGTLTKTGAGVLTLAANATYTGATTINGGTLIVSPGGNSGGGGIQGAITVNTGGALVIGSTNALIGNANIGTATVRVNSGGILTTADGVTTHAGNIVLNGGTLAAGVPDPTFGSFDLVSGKAITSVSGTPSTSTLSATGLNLETGSSINAFSGSTFNITGTIDHGQLTTGSVGTVTLSGANTYTGGTTLKAGTLRLIGAGTLGDSNGSLTFDRSSFASILDLNGTSQGVGNLTSAGTAQTATILNNNTGSASTLTIGNGDADGGNFTGVIADHTTGTGIIALTKTGAGTLTLSGANTYTGQTEVVNGTLTLASATPSASTVVKVDSPSGILNVSAGAALSNAAALTDDGTVNFNNATQQIGILNNNGIVNLNGTALSVGSGAFGGSINDNGAPGSLTKNGQATDTLTLTGTNGYTGGTTVSAGTLVLANTNADRPNMAISAGNITVTGDGAKLQLGADNQINDKVNLTLQTTSGAVGSVVFDLANHSETLGTLTQDPATIEFGSPTGISNTLQFANSSANAWTGTLSVQDYEYDFSGTGTPIDHLFFGSTASGLTAGQLGQISFVNVNGVANNNFGATMLSNGEVTIAPTPEPGSIIPIIVGMAGLGVLIARKRRKVNTENCQNELAEAV